MKKIITVFLNLESGLLCVYSNSNVFSGKSALLDLFLRNNILN